jgi:hypothetical protein
MRRYGRKDANHNPIVAALEKIGCSVIDLSPLGDGKPDALIWSPRLIRYVLAEIKDGAKAPSRRKLTPDQVKFHAEFRGPIVVLQSVDEALKLFGGVR